MQNLAPALPASAALVVLCAIDHMCQVSIWCSEADNLVPVRPDQVLPIRAANHRRHGRIVIWATGDIQLCFRKIANTRRESKPEQMHQGKDVVGEAVGIRVMLLDSQI